MDSTKKFRFIDFFKKIWWWNLLLDFALLLMCLYVMVLFWHGHDQEQASRIGGPALLLGILQFIFLSVLSLIYLFKKRFLLLLILLLHIVALFFLLDLLWLHFALSYFAI